MRTNDTVAALRGEQMALLGARRFTDALEHLKRVKAAEAKVRPPAYAHCSSAPADFALAGWDAAPPAH